MSIVDNKSLIALYRLSSLGYNFTRSQIEWANEFYRNQKDFMETECIFDFGAIKIDRVFPAPCVSFKKL